MRQGALIEPLKTRHQPPRAAREAPNALWRLSDGGVEADPSLVGQVDRFGA
jgi:hypothetical protein